MKDKRRHERKKIGNMQSNKTLENEWMNLVSPFAPSPYSLPPLHSFCSPLHFSFNNNIPTLELQHEKESRMSRDFQRASTYEHCPLLESGYEKCEKKKWKDEEGEEFIFE